MSAASNDNQTPDPQIAFDALRIHILDCYGLDFSGWREADLRRALTKITVDTPDEGQPAAGLLAGRSGGVQALVFHLVGETSRMTS